MPPTLPEGPLSVLTVGDSQRTLERGSQWVKRIRTTENAAFIALEGMHKASDYAKWIKKHDMLILRLRGLCVVAGSRNRMEKRLLTTMKDFITNFHEVAKPGFVIGSCSNVYWDEPQLHDLRSSRYIGCGKLPMCSFGAMCPDDGLSVANKCEVMTNATKVRELFSQIPNPICDQTSRCRR